MTTTDLFDTPTRQPRCGRCRAAVLRVRDTEIGINVDLNPTPLPVTEPVPAHRATYEHHPRAGWHCQSTPGRNGYPIHLMHTCTNASNESETTS